MSGTYAGAEQPRSLGNRYELGAVLGRGGMAEVFMARDTRLGRVVAVKTLRADLSRDPTFQARFRREAQSAASLNHPAIVAVYDTGEDHLPGDGTTVKIYLPRTLQEARPAVSSTTNLAMTGSETILLVDDDEVVRNTVSAMLEDLGYRVLNVENGEEALAALEREPDTALLFTDVVMPGMGGRQLAERAVQIHPSLRVLYTSGYTENAIVHNGRLDTGVDLLSKPYNREQLAAKVRRVLDASRKESTATPGIRLATSDGRPSE